MTATANLTIEQSANFSAVITVNHSNNDSYNLSSYTSYASLRRSYSAANAISFTVTNSDTDNGEITISLTHDQTSNLSYGGYVYDVIAQNDGNDSVIRIVEGQVLIAERVTVPQ